MTHDVPTHRPTALSARVAVLATAALAAVFGLPALSSADAVEGSAVAEPGNGVTGGVPARVALRRAEAAVNPDPGAEPARDATIALRDLALAFPRLEGADRRAARGLLARPTDKNDPQRDSYKTAEAAPLCSANFCVHYVAGTGDAPNLADVAPANGVPDYVEQISAAAETSFAVENGTLGWPDAKSDGSLGGAARASWTSTSWTSVTTASSATRLPTHRRASAAAASASPISCSTTITPRTSSTIRTRGSRCG